MPKRQQPEQQGDRQQRHQSRDTDAPERGVILGPDHLGAEFRLKSAEWGQAFMKANPARLASYAGPGRLRPSAPDACEVVSDSRYFPKPRTARPSRSPLLLSSHPETLRS